MTLDGEPFAAVRHDGDPAAVAASGLRRIVLGAEPLGESEQHGANERQQGALASLVLARDQRDGPVEGTQHGVAIDAEAVDL